MNTINVLLVEDTEAESDRIVTVLQKNHFSVAGIARSFREAIQLFNTMEVDIIVIDIFLNGRPDGIAFAEYIDVQPNVQKPFVFLTSATSRDVFDRAKLTNPFSYILKPFNELEFIYAIEMAIEKFYGQEDSLSAEEENTVIGKDFLFIKKGKSLKKVHTDAIIYIEVEEKYCNIITEKEKFVILISLVKILELLGTEQFFRTHRNYIVNLHKIEEIVPQDNLIILQGKHTVTLSTTYKDIVQKFRTLR